MATERAILQGSINGLVQVRNMFTCDVVPSGGDTSDILWEGYMSSILDAWEGMVHASVNFYQYEIQSWTGTQWETLNVVPCDVTGSNGDDATPNAVAFVMIGVAAGIRHLGRKFLGPLSETDISANNIVVGFAAAAAACLLAYITPFEGIGGGTITPGVLDKGGVFRPFVGGTISSLLGSMRRRKPGLGI